MIDELQETVETLIELDEPEAILPTLRRAAERQKGVRWKITGRGPRRGRDEARRDPHGFGRSAGPRMTPRPRRRKIGLVCSW